MNDLKLDNISVGYIAGAINGFSQAMEVQAFGMAIGMNREKR